MLVEASAGASIAARDGVDGGTYSAHRGGDTTSSRSRCLWQCQEKRHSVKQALRLCSYRLSPTWMGLGATSTFQGPAVFQGNSVVTKTERAPYDVFEEISNALSSFTARCALAVRLCKGWWRRDATLAVRWIERSWYSHRVASSVVGCILGRS